MGLEPIKYSEEPIVIAQIMKFSDGTYSALVPFGENQAIGLSKGHNLKQTLEFVEEQLTKD